MKLTEIFKKCEEISIAKQHDYTSAQDVHENFKRTEILLDWFNSPIDKPYVALIGTKLARLASLLGNKEPNNESIEDTFLDLVNYCALWAERRTENKRDLLKEITNKVDSQGHMKSTMENLADEHKNLVEILKENMNKVVPELIKQIERDDLFYRHFRK